MSASIRNIEIRVIEFFAAVAAAGGIVVVLR
jgi:hypothetical protein